MGVREGSVAGTRASDQCVSAPLSRRFTGGLRPMGDEGVAHSSKESGTEGEKVRGPCGGRARRGHAEFGLDQLRLKASQRTAAKFLKYLQVSNPVLLRYEMK